MNPSESDASYPQIAATIREMCKTRGPEKTICPSEVARELFPDNWREKMEAVRAVAVSLAGQGQIEITQQGSPVNPETAKGPVRLRIPSAE